MSQRQDAFFVSAALSVRGEVLAGEDVVIESNFEGTVSAPLHAVTVQAGARVMGEIDAAVVIVNGTAIGEIRAGAKIVVGSKGLVDGDLRAPTFVFEDGSRVRGTVNQGATDPAVMTNKRGAEQPRRPVVGRPGPGLDGARTVLPLGQS